MEVLKFDLLGKYAFFKNPESNIGTEFSFEHIHKPALQGILGSILGLQGKDTITCKNPIPEYYRVFENMKVSIIPSKPVFFKFKETVTNATGFANENSTQILERQILQDVKWTIYISKDNIDKCYWDKICELLMKHESICPLYLGNNAFKAMIDNVQIINLDKVVDNECLVIDGIFKQNIIKQMYDYTINDLTLPCDLEMYFPSKLNELNLYEYEWFRLCNLVIDVKENEILYKDNERVLSFF